MNQSLKISYLKGIINHCSINSYLFTNLSSTKLVLLLFKSVFDCNISSGFKSQFKLTANTSTILNISNLPIELTEAASLANNKI
jgi:hypothetical protein